MRTREELLARLRSGDRTEGLRRDLRLRRENWNALVDELEGAPELAPQPATPPPATCVCHGTGVTPSELLDRARWAAEQRPPANNQIDQVHTVVEDLARRATILMQMGDVDGKDLVFIGDDDFCSVLLASVAKPRSITVIDLDRRILGTLGELASKHGFPLKPYEYDLGRFVTDDRPTSLLEQHDVFVTDPPYSEAGMLLFAAVGAACLRPLAGSAGYIAVPWLDREEWSDELLYVVQRDLIEHGMLLTDVRRAFHTYLHEDGVFSTLVRAEKFLPRGSTEHMLRGWNRQKLYSSRRFAWETEDD
jgi:predicted methyltransferase